MASLNPTDYVLQTRKSDSGKWWAGFLCFLIVGSILIWPLFVGSPKGLVIWGDWVPLGSSYLKQIWLWNPVQHLGGSNYDFRQALWLAVLSSAAGPVGSVRFALVNRVFVILVMLLPGAAAYWTAGQMLEPRRSIFPQVAAVLGAILYAFNPWCLAQEASGHYTAIGAYALFPVIYWLASSTSLERDPERGSPGLVGAGTKEILLSSIKQQIACGAVLGIEPLVGIHMSLVALAIYSLSTVQRMIHATNKWALLVAVVRELWIAGALQLWWLVPTLISLFTLPSGTVGNTASVPLNAIQALTGLGGILHVLGARAYWWRPFSNAPYRLFGISQLDGFILAGSAVGIVLTAWPLKKSKLVAVLIGLGTVPIVIGHWWPVGYLWFVHQPLGDFFLDPSYFLPFYVLGLWILGLSAADHITRPREPQRVTQRLRSGHIAVASYGVFAIGVICAWLIGGGSVLFTPLVSTGNQLAAVEWLTHHNRAEVPELWLPDTPYLSVPWSKTTISDPVRFWSTATVLNPVEPAYYDSNPALTTAMTDLEMQMSASPSQGATPDLLKQYLAQVLAENHIGYVVIREHSIPPIDLQQIVPVVSSAHGLVLAADFGPVLIYRVLEPNANVPAYSAESPTLVDPAWRGALLAAVAGLGRGSVELPLYQGASGISNVQHLKGIVSSIWPLVFGLNSYSVPQQLQSNVTYPFAGVTGYEAPKGTTIRMQAHGIVGLWVAASFHGVVAACHGVAEGPSSTNFQILRVVQGLGPGAIVSQMPTVQRRWAAYSCTGPFTIRFTKPYGWLLGIENLSIQRFQASLHRAERIMTRRGSAYVVPFGELAQSTGHHHDKLATYRENPLWLPAGPIHVVARSLAGMTCRLTSVALIDQSSLRTIRLHQKSQDVYNATLLQGGFYQIALLDTVNTGTCSALAIYPNSKTTLGSISAHVQSAPGSKTIRYHRMSFLVVPSGVGPSRLFVKEGGHHTEEIKALPEGLFGQAFYARGSEMVSKPAKFLGWILLGAMVGAVALVAQFFTRLRKIFDRIILRVLQVAHHRTDS